MNLEKMTKSQLINYIIEKEDENNLKYGLNWNKNKEELTRIKIKKEIPILKELSEKEIKKISNTNNILIKGDNYYSVFVLNYTHYEKIDIIYIDPPYNNGNKDFIYNDSFVDIDDGYRHSKWLNFMNNRLELAKNLLKESGIIYISIGDSELAQLKLLCDRIFGEQNFITIISRIAKRTSNKGNLFKTTKDYILVYAKSINNITWKFGIEQEINKDEFIYEDENGKYKINKASLYQPSLDSRPNQRYYIKCPDGSFIIPPGNVFPKNLEDGAHIKPQSNDDKVWRWSYDTYLQNKDNLVFTKAGSLCPLIDSNKQPSKYNVYDKVYLKDKLNNTLLPEDVIYDYVNSQGTKELLELDINFPFAKPTGLIKYLIKLTRMPNDITVLDFFAGSGTTADAVLQLNKEDKGSRKFILCTNNENDIFEKITYKRLQRVINGYKKRAPLPCNLKVFEIDFKKYINNKDQLYYDITEEIIPLLCIKEDCYDIVSRSDEYIIYSNICKDKYLCIYFNLYLTNEEEFIEKLTKINKEKKIYKISLDNYSDIEEYKKINNYTIEFIPYKYINMYNRLKK